MCDLGVAALCSLPVCTQDDKYVMTVLSVDHPECPPLDGVPRAQVRSPQGNKYHCSCEVIILLSIYSSLMPYMHKQTFPVANWVC